MWLQPTIEHLQLVLAQDELDKLSSCSVDITDVLQKQLNAVADTFRSAFVSKGYTIDVRDHYVDAGYLIPVLNYARYQIFTRFPMAEDYALSEPRKKQYEEAAQLLKTPYLGVSRPDYSDDPQLSSDTSLSNVNDGAITMPWQKFPAVPFDTGFAQVYPFWRYCW